MKICFICKKEIPKDLEWNKKKWKENYCPSHENKFMIYNCHGNRDEAAVMDFQYHGDAKNY